MIRAALLIAVVVQSGCQSFSSTASNQTQKDSLTKTSTTSNQTPTESLTSSGVELDTAKWYKYTAPDGSHTALFPSKPKKEPYASSLTKEYTRTDVRYEGQIVNYGIKTSKYFKKLSKRDVTELLKYTINEKVDNNIYVLKYQNKINFNGREAYEYYVSERKWHQGERSIVFFDMNKSILYEIWAATKFEVSDNGILDTPQTNFFLSSLKLK